MDNPLTIAAGLSVLLLVIGALAATRGQWVIAGVFAKGAVVMALAIAPLGLGSIGAQTILMEEGSPARAATIDGGIAQLRGAAYLALPALLVGGALWLRARRRPRRPLD